MIGDKLARGAKSVTFPSSSHIPQSKWDLAFNNYHPDSETVYTVPPHIGKHVEVPEGVKVTRYKAKD